MTRLRLRNNRLKFKTTAGKLPIILRKTYRIYPNTIKDNWRMSTYNRLDLQTLRSQPVMPKNLPNHWFKYKVWFKMGQCPSQATNHTVSSTDGKVISLLYSKLEIKKVKGLYSWRMLYYPGTRAIKHWDSRKLFRDVTSHRGDFWA